MHAVQNVKTPDRRAAYCALPQGEFVGTFLFVFLATTGTGTALAIGVSYTVASYAVAALSGGHLNPLISIAFALSGHQHAALSGEILEWHTIDATPRPSCKKMFLLVHYDDAVC